MEYLAEITVRYLQEWNAPLLSIFIGLFFVYWELLKANKKLDQIKRDAPKKSVRKLSDGSERTQQEAPEASS